MLTSPDNFRLVFAYSLFLFGLTFIGAGFWRLLSIGLNAQAKTLAAQTVRIGQKALSDDITRVTQATQQLLDSVNNLLRTSAGVGAFLIFIGLLMMVGSYVVVFVLQSS
jgi:hypothetical protein